MKNKKQIKSFTKIVLTVLLLFYFIFIYTHVYATPVEEYKLVELANRKRVMNGLKPLMIDSSLYFAATAKAKDMIDKNYFDHFSPSGKSPWDFINNAGYEYQTAGENLAMDFRTSEGTNTAWMNSPAHRDNILDSDFENIAIAVIHGKIDNHDTDLVVEMFGKRSSSWTSKVNLFISKISNFLLGF